MERFPENPAKNAGRVIRFPKKEKPEDPVLETYKRVGASAEELKKYRREADRNFYPALLKEVKRYGKKLDRIRHEREGKIKPVK